MDVLSMNPIDFSDWASTGATRIVQKSASTAASFPRVANRFSAEGLT
jgi:hypothetical protein